MKRYIYCVVLFTLVCCSLHAENSKLEKGYEVYYNAFSSDFLSKEVAKNYQIGRSKTRGVINLSILKKQDNSVSIPVEAKIKLHAQNLYGQNKDVTLRKINESSGAIYYIGTFSVSSRETINFKATVLPKGSKSAIEIKFSQEFFTD